MTDRTATDRVPSYFWHNLGPRTKSRGERPSESNSLGITEEEINAWWLHLREAGEISFNSPSRPVEAEKCLRNYITGDTVFAYVSGYGVVGWGVVSDPHYERIRRGSAEDVYPRRGLHLHRLHGISWLGWSERLDKAVSAASFKHICAPAQQARACLADHKDPSKAAQRGKLLIALLEQKFGTQLRRPSPSNVDDPEIELERDAGFQSDVRIRKAIEGYAMEKARSVLEDRGYHTFVDTSLKECYDYTCHKGRLYFVEVKGVQTDGRKVILTHNEVEHARRVGRDSMIFVLIHSVRVDSKDGLRVTNGTVVVRERWQVGANELKPIQYFWTVK